MGCVAIIPDQLNPGSTPRCIPLTVNNTGAWCKSSLNFIKRQIFIIKLLIFIDLFISFVSNRVNFDKNFYLCICESVICTNNNSFLVIKFVPLLWDN